MIFIIRNIPVFIFFILHWLSFLSFSLASPLLALACHCYINILNPTDTDLLELLLLEIKLPFATHISFYRHRREGSFNQNYLITVSYFIPLCEMVQSFLLKQPAKSSDRFFKLNQEV